MSTLPQQIVTTTSWSNWNWNPASIPIYIVGILALLAFGIVTSVQRSRERNRRLELLEAALRNPSLSTETQRQLIQSLKPQPARWPFVVGWLGAAAGIGMLCMDLRGFELWVAVNVTAISFGLVTLPLALRELEARRS